MVNNAETLVHAVGTFVGALAMLDAIIPFPDVHVSVSPLVGAKSMHFVILPLSDVLSSVGPRVGAQAFLFAMLPFSDVHISAEGLVGALAMRSAIPVHCSDVLSTHHVCLLESEYPEYEFYELDKTPCFVKRVHE